MSTLVNRLLPGQIKAFKSLKQTDNIDARIGSRPGAVRRNSAGGKPRSLANRAK